MKETVLSVTDLNVSYGSKVAVGNISFEVYPKEIFGFLGPNGAGKTSTLSAIEGLIRPTSGQITVCGVDNQKESLLAKSKIGVQLQATSFQPELTIYEIIRLYAGLYGASFSKEDIISKLQESELTEEANKPFKQLSGGQQQRLSLLIALISKPTLLLLDEPTSGLDPQSRRQLWDRIENIRATGGSILLTTHSMEEAQSVCDRVAIIDHGKVLTVDTVEGLIKKHKDDPNVKKVARGAVTLEDVFIGLTGSEVRN